MYPILLLNDPPVPTYPEYADLADRARRNTPRFVDPANVYPCRPVVARRGGDWCTAVLGFPFTGLRGLNGFQDRLLIEADKANIDPPLPGWVLEGREEGARRLAEREAQRVALIERDRRVWAAALEQTDVTLTVRSGSRPRVRRGFTENLRHAVPTADVYSGARRVRVHVAGRALCETEKRQPLALSGETTEPATCVRCLGWVPQVRAVRRDIDIPRGGISS